METAQAAEAGRLRHFGYRQGGVGEQLLGAQQPPGLQHLQGRYAEMLGEHAAQVPGAHPQPGRQPFHRWRRVSVAEPVRRVVQPARGLLGQDGGGVFGRPVALQRSEFGPASQAGAKARLFGLRGVIEKAAVLALGRAHPAHRPAVDAGGGDAHEQPTVKARVVRAQGAVEGFVVGPWWGVHASDGTAEDVL